MATTTNYGWTTPDDTALVKDGASAIRTLGSSIDTSLKTVQNTIGAYTTGSWTPGLEGSTTPGSPTYTNQLGRYTKIGRLVVADFYISITSKSTMAGTYLFLTGLPFASVTQTNLFGTGISPNYDTNSGTATAPLTFEIQSNATKSYIKWVDADGSSILYLSPTNIGNSFYMYGQVTYPAAS